MFQKVTVASASVGRVRIPLDTIAVAKMILGGLVQRRLMTVIENSVREREKGREYSGWCKVQLKSHKWNQVESESFVKTREREREREKHAITGGIHASVITRSPV